MILARKVRIAKVVVYNKQSKEIENLEIEILAKKVRDISKYVESTLDYPSTVIEVNEVTEVNETYDIPTDIANNYKLSIESEEN